MEKILIIEDDIQFSTFLEDLLLDRGYDVKTANDGTIGLAYVEQYKPDVIITDIVMPEKEGVEVILDLRQRGIKTPIIAISGGPLQNANSYLTMAKKLGANVTLSEPFKIDELVTEIDKLLKMNA